MIDADDLPQFAQTTEGRLVRVVGRATYGGGYHRVRIVYVNDDTEREYVRQVNQLFLAHPLILLAGVLDDE